MATLWRSCHKVAIFFVSGLHIGQKCPLLCGFSGVKNGVFAVLSLLFDHFRGILEA